MASCTTCRHNDARTRFCSVMNAHTDLGYVLNCVAWTPTDEAEKRRLRDENAKLMQLVRALEDCRHTTCDDCVRWDYQPCGGCSLDGALRELGVIG